MQFGNPCIIRVQYHSGTHFPSRSSSAAVLLLFVLGAALAPASGRLTAAAVPVWLPAAWRRPLYPISCTRIASPLPLRKKKQCNKVKYWNIWLIKVTFDWPLLPSLSRRSGPGTEVWIGAWNDLNLDFGESCKKSTSKHERIVRDGFAPRLV